MARPRLIILVFFVHWGSVDTEMRSSEMRSAESTGDYVLSQLLRGVVASSLQLQQQLCLIGERDLDLGGDDVPKTIFSGSVEGPKETEAQSRAESYDVVGSAAGEALEALYGLRPRLWRTSRAVFVVDAHPGRDWILKAANFMFPVAVAVRFRGDAYAVFAVCLFCNASRPGLKQVQTWMPGTKHVQTWMPGTKHVQTWMPEPPALKDLFPDLQKDFHGKVLEVSSIPVASYDWESNETMASWTGFEARALEAMASHFHFRVSIIR